MAQTFNWFTQQLDALTAQNQALEQERDRLQSQKPDTEKVSILQAENARLQRELAEAKQQLEGIYKVLGQPVPSRNGSAGVAAPPPKPTAAPEPEPRATTAVTVAPAVTTAEAAPQTAPRQRSATASTRKRR